MDQDIQQKTAELLAQLHDVHVPPSDWWPPAPGWWFLAVLLLALMAFVVAKSIKKRRDFQWVTVAEAELAELKSAFSAHKLSSQDTVSRLSILIRRSAMAALGRRAVARATDEQWLQVLGKVSGGQGFARSTALKLVSAPYSPEPLAEHEVMELIDSCATWLKAARSVRRSADV